MGSLTEDMTRLSGEINVLRMAREEFIRDLKQDVTVLKGNVLEMRTAFRGAHAEMAGKTKAERAAFVSDLNKTVKGLRQEIAADIAGAHLAWFGLSEHTEAGPRARKKAEQPRGARAEAKPEVVEEVTPDDLTTIMGIGSATQARLNKAGIHTYAQLARSNPDDVQKALGKMARLAGDVEKWIEQARKLAEGS